MSSGTIYRSEFRRHNFLRRLNFHGLPQGGYRGKTITPHGPVPAGIVAGCVVGKIHYRMLFDGPLAK